MPNLTLSIGGRPLKIQCSDQNVERVKEIGQTISKLIDDEKKENVPFLTSTLIAYLKSMEDILKKEKILQDSLNQKLFYESRIQELQNENQNLKSDIEQIFQKLNHQLSIE
jgi:cell division protein ZapA (FtsZ GTPase activity inhibitor)